MFVQLNLSDRVPALIQFQFIIWMASCMCLRLEHNVAVDDERLFLGVF